MMASNAKMGVKTMATWKDYLESAFVLNGDSYRFNTMARSGLRPWHVIRMENRLIMWADSPANRL
jgi:hypothetical protein